MEQQTIVIKKKEFKVDVVLNKDGSKIYYLIGKNGAKYYTYQYRDYLYLKNSKTDERVHNGLHDVRLTDKNGHLEVVPKGTPRQKKISSASNTG